MLQKAPRGKKPRLSASPAEVVQCVCMSASQFADAVLNSEVMPTSLHDECLAWIKPEKVARFRSLFPLPPEEHLAGVGNHKFGQQGVTIKHIYDKVVVLNNTTTKQGVADDAKTLG